MKFQNISIHGSKLILSTHEKKKKKKKKKKKLQMAKNCKRPYLQQNFIKFVENLIK